MRSIRIPFFQIWYSSAFLTLAFVAWVGTLVTPADMIYMSIRAKNIPNGISIGSVYVLTIIISIFIWSSRIYTNRAVLREIPRSYIPVDKGEVPRKVHKMIVKQWERSALVAWDSRPRDVREELRVERLREEDGEHNRHEHGITALWRGPEKERTVINPTVASQAWGYISHPGWSSPASDTLPDVEYWRVFVELPNLIEAKAVSLVPPDPVFLESGLMDSGLTPVPDARIVALVQRPASQGLRAYLDRLMSLNAIEPPENAEAFLQQYEYARFSANALTESQFNELMASFSTLLTSMTGLDLAIVDQELEGSSSASSLRSYSTLDESTSHLRPERLSGYTGGPSRSSSRYTHVRTNSTGTVHTAPSRAKTPQALHHMPSDISLASQPESVTRTRFGDAQLLRSSSNLSLRSDGSVIRHPSLRLGALDND